MTINFIAYALVIKNTELKKAAIKNNAYKSLEELLTKRQMNKIMKKVGYQVNKHKLILAIIDEVQVPTKINYKTTEIPENQQEIKTLIFHYTDMYEVFSEKKINYIIESLETKEFVIDLAKLHLNNRVLSKKQIDVLLTICNKASEKYNNINY